MESTLGMIPESNIASQGPEDSEAGKNSRPGWHPPLFAFTEVLWDSSNITLLRGQELDAMKVF